MRRHQLLTQALLANLLLILAAVVAAVIATTPDNEFRETGAAGLILGFAVAATVAVNVFLLSRRFRPLERLTDEMERVNLSEPRPWPPEEEIGGPEEVQRLQQSFHRMLDRLEAERRRRASAALEAQERERTRVARDLHDEVNQALTALILRLEALRTRAPEELSGEIAETAAVAGEAMQELLTLARQLRPSALDDLGLTAALAGLVEEIDRRSEIEASFAVERDESEALPPLGDELQLVVYRVAQEAFSNAVRHAGASRIEVRLRRSAAGLELTVADDGGGFDTEAADAGLGLAGMRERALLVGGRLEIASRPGRGTTVRLALREAEVAAPVTRS